MSTPYLIDCDDFFVGCGDTKPVEGVDYIRTSDPVTHSPELIAARIPGLLNGWKDNDARRAAVGARMSADRKSGKVKNIYTPELRAIRSARMVEVWAKRKAAAL